MAGFIHWPFGSTAKGHPPAPTIWQWLLRLGTAVARGTRGRRCTRSTSTRRPEETAENRRETAMGNGGMITLFLGKWTPELSEFEWCYAMLCLYITSCWKAIPVLTLAYMSVASLREGLPCFSLGLKASKFKIAARVQCLGRPETQAKCGASWRCFLRLEL